MQRAWFAILASTVFVGCNSLLGIDEATLLEDAGAGAAAGAGGSAGADAALGGSAGSSGQAGASASSGASGSDGGCTITDDDPKNCGWCNHDCGTAPCILGTCKPEELNTLSYASDFAFSADSIFVAGGVSNALYKMSKQGGSLQTWPAGDEVRPLSLFDTYVYVCGYNLNVMWRQSTTGTLAPTQLFTTSSTINGLLAEATGLYYYEFNSQRIRRASLAGTNAIDFATKIGSVWLMRSDGTDIWAGSVNSGVYRIPKAGTLPIDASSLVFYDTTFDGPAALALDQSSVYFATGNPDEQYVPSTSNVMRVAKDKSSQKTLASSNTLVLAIETEGGLVYWTEEGVLQNDFGDGAVRAIEIDNPAATVRTYAVNQRYPTAVAVDAEWLYWLNGGWTPSTPGGVMRVRR